MYRPSTMIESYAKEIEGTMIEFCNSLPEKDQRQYAAVEVQKLGRSGITYVAKLLGSSRSKSHAEPVRCPGQKCVPT